MPLREAACQRLLVRRGRQPSDPIGAPDGTALPEQEQHQGRRASQRRRLVRLLPGTPAAEGDDRNWIQTVPGKGSVCLFRLYGPLEPCFDKSWRPGETELLA